jgi:hypothetical protein
VPDIRIPNEEAARERQALGHRDEEQAGHLDNLDYEIQYIPTHLHLMPLPFRKDRAR